MLFGNVCLVLICLYEKSEHCPFDCRMCVFVCIPSSSSIESYEVRPVVESCRDATHNPKGSLARVRSSPDSAYFRAGEKGHSDVDCVPHGRNRNQETHRRLLASNDGRGRCIFLPVQFIHRFNGESFDHRRGRQLEDCDGRKPTLTVMDGMV